MIEKAFGKTETKMKQLPNDNISLSVYFLNKKTIFVIRQKNSKSEIQFTIFKCSYELLNS